MKRCKAVWLFCSVIALLLNGCDADTIIDSNISLPARNWNYANKIKVVVPIKDVSKSYNIYFKLRHTADYRYSNIFVLAHLTGGGNTKRTIRYEYNLAKPDGQWNGAGSGNLFTYVLPLLTNYRFFSPGNYQIEIEQNMRDNPLKEISDAGIKVTQ